MILSTTKGGQINFSII